MTILGGFIHKLGIVKLGGLPTKLGFVPDYMEDHNHIDANTGQALTLTNRRFGFSNHSVGNWSADVNTDTTIFSCCMTKAGALRYIEIRVPIAGSVTSEYYASIEHTSVSNTLVSVTALLTGTFTDNTGDTFIQGSTMCGLWRRGGATSGGNLHSILRYVWKWD